MRLSVRYISRQQLLRLAGLMLGVLALLFATARLWLPKIGHWLAQPRHVTRVDAIIVLGGGDGERTMQALDLYKDGLAPELWHTGHGWNWVELDIQQGVPREHIHLLPSTSTWEDAQAIAAFAQRQKVRRILVVTDWYHSRRALCTIQHHLAGSRIEIYNDSPPTSSDGPDNWWQSKSGRSQVLSELGKIVYYWLRYGLNPWQC